MIIVRLEGGLGNQMFQYAFGRKLAILNNTSLKIDVSKLLVPETENVIKRQYKLDFLNINATLAKQQDIELFYSSEHFYTRYRNLAFKLLGYTAKVHEQAFDYHTNALVKCKNVYVTGYWQSYKYFNSITNYINTELQIKKSFKPVFDNLMDEINTTHSIAVHFRRGDYVSNAATQQFHGVCSVEYYIKAISYFKEKLIKPRFYIFSDDMDWVKQNIEMDASFRMIEGYADYGDMYLMSQCKHQIIANSSFSWWGAWLNSNPHKMVVAPKNWFADPSINTSDLIPLNWITL